MNCPFCDKQLKRKVLRKRVECDDCQWVKAKLIEYVVIIDKDSNRFWRVEYFPKLKTTMVWEYPGNKILLNRAGKIFDFKTLTKEKIFGKILTLANFT